MHTTVTPYEAELIVDSKSHIAEGVATLTLRDPKGSGCLPRWTPGAHIDVALLVGVVRQYSLCGDLGDLTAFRIAVLREPESRGGSRYIDDELKTGDILSIRGLRNNFPLVSSKRYIFIAGGIGITPILPMVRAANEAGAEWRLLYGGRKRASMAFLDKLAQYNDKVHVAPQDEVGLLHLNGWLATLQQDCSIYCCGPEPLLRAVEARCSHWPAGFLHIERFKPRDASERAPNTEFEVELRRSGVTLAIPPDKSIVQTLEDAGISVLHSCREGLCGTCETRVLDGIPEHRDSVLSNEEKAGNRTMMICVSRSCTKRLVLDI